MKPQILFEDAEILVCHKPAGTAVQTASFSAQDMVSILKNHLALEMRKKETVKGPKTSAPYLAVIHRLDQPVEGDSGVWKDEKCRRLFNTPAYEERF